MVRSEPASTISPEFVSKVTEVSPMTVWLWVQSSASSRQMRGSVTVRASRRSASSGQPAAPVAAGSPSARVSIRSTRRVTVGESVEAFSAEYEKLGGKIVAAETINPDDDKYDAVIREAFAHDKSFQNTLNQVRFLSC